MEEANNTFPGLYVYCNLNGSPKDIWLINSPWKGICIWSDGEISVGRFHEFTQYQKLIPYDGVVHLEN